MTQSRRLRNTARDIVHCGISGVGWSGVVLLVMCVYTMLVGSEMKVRKNGEVLR